MRDEDLIRRVTLRSSGADIHEVQNLISGYEEACAIASDPGSFEDLLVAAFNGKRKTLVKWATKRRRLYERSLRTYLAGVPARHAADTLWNRHPKIRSARALAKVAGKRLRRVNAGNWKKAQSLGGDT